MLVGRRRSQDLVSPGCVARSSLDEAEERAPCFLLFFLGFKPQTAASTLLGRNLRGAGLLACRDKGTTQELPSEARPSSLTSAFGLGSPWRGLLSCLPAWTTQVSTSRAGKMWASGSPH